MNYTDTTSTTKPKVTCICPTRGRFEILRESISFFLLQDYPNKELIIFNNHEIPIKAHPKLEKHQIRVINAGDYSGKSMESLYADVMKLVSSDTDFISIWDDDDFYFPWHLSSNIEKLIQSDKLAIRARFGYWQDINHQMGDHYTIIQNTLEASMIARVGSIFFNQNDDPNLPNYTHPHTSWVSDISNKNCFLYNEDITACFRWGYGKKYPHLQSVGPHKMSNDTGLGELLRPVGVSWRFYDLIQRAHLTTKDGKIVNFDSETKSNLLKRFLENRIDKYDHVDKWNVWLYWDKIDRPKFIDLCHQSIQQNTFANVIILNDETLHKYHPPKEIYDLAPVQRSDYLRIHLLYTYGGWWFNSDTYVVGDLDEYYFSYLNNHESVFPWEYNVVGNMTTPIFSSKPKALIITEALKNIKNYLSTNPKIGWSGIGINGILKSVSTYKHRGEGYYFGLPDIAVFGYNNNLINQWNFEKISNNKLSMIIFHWSQIGTELSCGDIDKITDMYPNFRYLFSLNKFQ
jgi:hypothetical protein